MICSQVRKDSAAEKAGLSHNDIILEVDGKPVESALDLQTRIAMIRPGTEVVLTLWRNEKREILKVELGKRPSADQLRAQEEMENVSNMLGFKIDDVNETTAQYYGIEKVEGVVVTDVETNSQARRSGIVVGTLIKEINRQKIKNKEEFAREIERVKNNGTSNILFWGEINGSNYNFFLKLP